MGKICQPKDKMLYHCSEPFPWEMNISFLNNEMVRPAEMDIPAKQGHDKTIVIIMLIVCLLWNQDFSKNIMVGICLEHS